MSEIQNRSPWVEGVTWAMFAIAMPPVLIRIWARISLTKSFGVDDWLMVLAMISFTFNTVICYEGAVHGTGRHYWNLDLDSMTTAFKWWYFAYLTYCTSMVLVKSSIACFLLRLTPDRTHRLIIYVAWGLTVVCGTVFFFIAMFQCSPVSYFWVRVANPGAGSCISVDVIVYATFGYSGSSILTDFTYTILPIWMIWKLQMSLKTKLVLIPVMSMAAVASCAVVVRMAFINNFRGDDFLWSTADIAIWSQVEIGLAIAAGSLVTLRPFFRRVLHKLGFTGLSTSRSNVPRPQPGVADLLPCEEELRRAAGKGKSRSPISRIMAQYSLFSLQSNPTRVHNGTLRMEEGVFSRDSTRYDGDRVRVPENAVLQTSSRESLVEPGITSLGDANSMHDSCYSKLSYSEVQAQSVDQ